MAVLVQDDRQRQDSRMGRSRDQVAGKRLAQRVAGVLSVLALGAGGCDMCACACVVAA